MMCPRDRSQAFGAPEVGERSTGPGGELIHAEIRIGDPRDNDHPECRAGPVRSPDRVRGIITCVTALYWQDVGTNGLGAGGQRRGRDDLPAGGSGLR
jgi:hypothetical protein